MTKDLQEAGFESEVDTNPGDTMNKKIRNAQLEQWNYIMGEYIRIYSQCKALIVDSHFLVTIRHIVSTVITNAA